MSRVLGSLTDRRAAARTLAAGALAGLGPAAGLPVRQDGHPLDAAGVRDLGIDGAALTGPCVGDRVSGIAFDRCNGEITGVSIANLSC